jgi:hypothetical protein
MELSDMEEKLSVGDLRKRWEHALHATARAVSAHPKLYGELKSVAASIVDQPLDIKEYFPTAEKLTRLLHTLDPGGNGSIFDLFGSRFSPQNIWQVRLLRMECRDLLAHLQAFDQWRRESRHLRLVR